MLIERIWSANPLRNFHYLIACPETGEALAVDPLEWRLCLDAARQKGWTITQILNTHEHPDHTGGNEGLVGATQAKADASASAAADWQVYSHYLEERVTVSPQKIASGSYNVATSQLLPGEYGLVLQPVSKDKKFSGGDVSRAQGDGLMFDAIWTFEIANDAQ